MIQMTKDFRGRASGERYFKAGEIVTISEEFEEAMISEGVAIRVTGTDSPTITEEEAPKKARKK